MNYEISYFLTFPIDNMAQVLAAVQQHEGIEFNVGAG